MSTSIQYIGNNPAGKGKTWQGTSPPSDISTYKRWWDTETGAAFVYYTDGNSAQWIKEDPALAQNNVNVWHGLTPPADPDKYPMWWDTETGENFIYYQDSDSRQWVQESPAIPGEDGIDGVVVAPAPIAGDILAARYDLAITVSEFTYTEYMKIYFPIAGSVRAVIDIFSNNNSGYAQLYLNGIPIGIERFISGSTTQVFSEDIFITPNSYLELWAKTSNNTISIRAFEIRQTQETILVPQIDVRI